MIVLPSLSRFRQPALLRRLARVMLAVYAAWWLTLAGLSLLAHGEDDPAPHVRLAGHEWVVLTHHADAGKADAFAPPSADPALHHEVSLKLDVSRLQLLLACCLPVITAVLWLFLPFLAGRKALAPPPGGLRFPRRNHATALIATLRLQV